MPLPEPPYIAVIFAAQRRETDTEDGGAYAATAARMENLARAQDGFLGLESARGPDGLGVTVSYWRDEDAVGRWREHAEHTLVREMGRERFYNRYTLRVARVERQYDWAL